MFIVTVRVGRVSGRQREIKIAGFYSSISLYRTCVIQYDGEMASHYAPIDGITSPVYDPTATGHHGRVTGSLPLQPSAALPRSPTYSPHPSATAAVSSLASPYPAAGAGASGVGYASAAGAAAAVAAVAMNSSSSAAAVAAVDSLLKRDKDAIYRYN